jgi:hypothetical protein
MWTYYERWAVAMSTILTERGLLTTAELSQELFHSSIAHANMADRAAAAATATGTTNESPVPRFAVGAPVQVLCTKFCLKPLHRMAVALKTYA